jgi:hypothetical protein
MLLSGRVLACYGRAAAAKRKAEAIRNPAKKADFLKMEEGWLSLARSLEASDHLTDFIGTAKVNKDLGGVSNLEFRLGGFPTCCNARISRVAENGRGVSTRLPPCMPALLPRPFPNHAARKA